MAKERNGFVRKNDIAAVVGFATATRGQAPWNNPKIDLFGLNEEYSWSDTPDNPETDLNKRWWKAKMENVAGWYQLHPYATFTRESNHNDPKHWEWLQKKHPFPIFMQDKYPEVPSSVKLPIEDIYNEFLTPDGRRYFTSSIALIMGHLYLLGYKRIELYGFEMASNTEYYLQRPCASWMGGRLRARGIDLYVPPSGSFLSGPVYAYEDIWIGWRQDMEVNMVKLISKNKELKEQIELDRGALQVYTELVKIHPEIREEADKFYKELVDKEDTYELQKGRVQGMNFAIKYHDIFLNFTPVGEVPSNEVPMEQIENE